MARPPPKAHRACGVAAMQLPARARSRRVRLRGMGDTAPRLRGFFFVAEVECATRPASAATTSRALSARARDALNLRTLPQVVGNGRKSRRRFRVRCHGRAASPADTAQTSSVVSARRSSPFIVCVCAPLAVLQTTCRIGNRAKARSPARRLHAQQIWPWPRACRDVPAGSPRRTSASPRLSTCFVALGVCCSFRAVARGRRSARLSRNTRGGSRRDTP